MNKLTELYKDESIAYVGGNYYVTSYGRVYNERSKKFSYKPCGDDKYYRVCIDGKKHRIHRLVAECFIPNPDNKPFVDHIDGDRYNNRADNLEWVTEKENNKRKQFYYDNYCRLTIEDLIRIQRASQRYPVEMIRKHFKISVPQMRKILEMNL